MATKAVYAKIDGVYYNVDQSMEIPKIIFTMPSSHSQMTLNKECGAVDSTVWINPICAANMKSNKECYDEMIQELKEKKITQIDTIFDRHVMYLDYSILDKDGKEVEHSVTSKPLEPIDELIPFGCGENNELVYKQVKCFKTDMSFTVKNDFPFGIMKDCSNIQYQVRLNDIAIYQDTKYGNSNFQDIHNSCVENCYKCGSHTVASVFKDMKKVYSTSDAGLIINAVEIPFVPRTVTLHFNMVLDNSIVVYDKETVTSVLVENLENKYNPKPATPVIPDGEKYPVSDGVNEPDETGFYDYYTRVTDDEPGRLLVVEDELTGELYDNTRMIHKEMVIFDIPDVAIGEYVKYVTNITASE